jgi:hypothetical protein
MELSGTGKEKLARASESFKELTAADTEYHCELCRVAKVHFTFHEDRPQYDTPMTEKERHRLVHEGCSDFDDPSLGSLVDLCGFCRHLRPRHLMRCWREKFLERFISDHGQTLHRPG